MTHIDGDAEYERIQTKFENHEVLTDEDLMKLIVLLITQTKNDDISGMIDNVIDLVEEMKNADVCDCAFVLSAMSVALRNYITEEQKNENMGGINNNDINHSRFSTRSRSNRRRKATKAKTGRSC